MLIPILWKLLRRKLNKENNLNKTLKLEELLLMKFYLTICNTTWELNMRETKILEEVKEKMEIKIQMKNRVAKSPRKSKTPIQRARVNQKEKIKKTLRLPKNQNANSNDF